MKYISNTASCFKLGPNEFGTLQFDDSDRPPPSHRYFVPRPYVADLLKSASVFGRITLEEDANEAMICEMFFAGPMPVSFEPFLTYTGKVLVIFSQNEEEHYRQWEAVNDRIQMRELSVFPPKTMKGVRREWLERAAMITLNIEQPTVELCDELMW